MNTKTEPAIQSTTDYSVFTRVEGNRPIKRGHVRNLIESIKEQNLLPSKPIIVTKDMGIIDGQHRLEAAKILGLPISYIVADNGVNDLSIPMLNDKQYPWTTEDYVRYFVIHDENENYIKLRKYHEDYHLGYPIVADLLRRFSVARGGAGLRNGIRDGSFKVLREEETVDFLEKYSSLKPVFRKVYTDRCFVEAFVRAYKNLPALEITWEAFKKKMEDYPYDIKRQPGVDEYMELIDSIYNYRKQNPIRFI